MDRFLVLCCLFAAALASSLTEAGDNNRVYSPCTDTHVAVGDGFTFGIAFAARDSFFGPGSANRSVPVQYSPCDRRRLSLNGNSEIAVFRPKVDEITLLTINSSNFRPHLELPLFPKTVNPSTKTNKQYKRIQKIWRSKEQTNPDNGEDD